MIELNLLPDVKKEFIRAQRSHNAVITASILAIMISVGATIAFALFVYGGQAFRISQLTGNIKEKETQLKAVEDLDKYLTVQNQLSQIEGLHDQKLIYSRLVDFLGVLNPSAPHNISLNRLNVQSEEGTIVFEGSTASFESFSVFKDTLQNAELTYTAKDATEPTKERLFSEVVVTSSGLGKNQSESRVSFSVTATYSENVFSPSSKDIAVTIPQIETTNSVRQSPQPLFNSQQEGAQ